MAPNCGNIAILQCFFFSLFLERSLRGLLRTSPAHPLAKKSSRVQRREDDEGVGCTNSSKTLWLVQWLECHGQHARNSSCEASRRGSPTYRCPWYPCIHTRGPLKEEPASSQQQQQPTDKITSCQQAQKLVQWRHSTDGIVEILSMGRSQLRGSQPP